MSESVILCEGYHDRAFWAGWLEHVGCTDLSWPPGSAKRVAVFDPWGRKVTGGQFGFHSKSGRFVRILPCLGDIRRVSRKARSRLAEERDRLAQWASESRLARLVLNVDSDVRLDDAEPERGFRLPNMQDLAREFDPDATQNEHGDSLLFGGAVTVSLIRWETNDDRAAGLPNQQTLERLVCAALVAAYPDRGPAVQKWLDSRPQASDAGPKEFGWSYMAGWYAERACEGFFRKLWLDEPVAAELQSRLEQSGAWRIAQALAE